MEQRSSEWFQARDGKLTASRFGDVIAKPETKRYQSYMQDVAWGRLGVPNFAPEDLPWFDHGKEWEPEARGFYQWETGIEIQEVGLIVHPQYPFIAASPDGIAPDRGLEIKCRKSLSGHLETVRKKVDSIYVPQIQGGMWVCGLDKWDFVSFYKGQDKRLIHVHTVGRDEAFIKRLEEACLRFNENVNQLVRELSENGIRAERHERIAVQERHEGKGLAP